MSAAEKRKVVLVVDDTPFNLQTASNVLRPTYDVRATPDGAKALALLARRPDVDLILLDILMPDLDGYEVCRRVKADPATAGIPVIFMSALQGEQDERTAREAGGVDFVRKPFEPEQLLASVAKWLDSSVSSGV